MHLPLHSVLWIQRNYCSFLRYKRFGDTAFFSLKQMLQEKAYGEKMKAYLLILGKFISLSPLTHKAESWE